MPSIVFVVPELLPVPPSEGGAVEHWVHEVSQRLARAGFAVSVVSRPSADAGAADVAYIGVPWSRAGRWWLALKQAVHRRNPLRSLAKLVNVLGYAVAVRRALRDVDADLLYVHNDPLLALLLGRRPGRKLVLHMHNDHLSVAALRPLLARLMARTELVLCVSDYIRDRACGALPAHASKMQTVLNATDPDLFRPDLEAVAVAATRACPPPPVEGQQSAPGAASVSATEPVAAAPSAPSFLYVGRLTEDKGVHVLIAAFARVHATHPDSRLIVAGSSFYAHAPRTDYERRLAAQAAPLAHAIAFSGFVPHAQLRFLYASADVVVVPSIWQEPFGLVALEAMSSQACVVASAVGGLPELVAHERTGLLVPADDAAALADAMARLLADAVLRQRLGRAARADVVRRFSYTRLAGELTEKLGGLARTPIGVAHPQLRGQGSA